MVTVVLIYSNNCAIWILLTTNNCEGLFGSFTPSVKAKVKVVAASYCGTGTGGTTLCLCYSFTRLLRTLKLRIICHLHLLKYIS